MKNLNISDDYFSKRLPPIKKREVYQTKILFIYVFLASLTAFFNMFLNGQN